MAPLVCVVDDDDSVRESLVSLLGSVGFDVEVFASAESFLASDVRAGAACLLLDVRMPRMTGPELQAELANRGEHHVPIVFITGQTNETVRVRALTAGAVAFLVKPFDDDDLLEAIDLALKRAQ